MKYSLLLVAVFCFVFIHCDHEKSPVSEEEARFFLKKVMRIDGHITNEIYRAKRQADMFQVNREDAMNGYRRRKRDMQNRNEHETCLCGTNKDGSAVSDTSNCVCNIYPRPNMNNNNNNMGSTVYHNIYHICNCGTDPNPNNVMKCCTSSSNINNNCNCCTTCKCGCSNGTKSCTCSGCGVGNTCSSTSCSRGNVCYTFDKTCGCSQNTENHPQTSTAISNHHGPIFIYNSYYYYCTCKSNNNLRHPSSCSIECACGCQANTTMPSDERKGAKTDRYEPREFTSFDSTRESKVDRKTVVDSTKHPQMFTDTHTQTKSSVRYHDNINYGKTDSTKSKPNTFTDTLTDAPRHSQQPRNPTSQSKTSNQNNGETNNKQAGSRNKASIDLAELYRHL